MNRIGATPRGSNFGISWLLLCLAFGLHTWDEAAHEFLKYYDATVLALYGHFSWFPRMDLEVRNWLGGLVVVNLILLTLTPWAFRNASWLRPPAYVFAAIQFLNGMGHIAAKIRGHTVPSVQFNGPAPGVYTAPILLLLSAYLFWSLTKTSAREPKKLA